MNRILRLIDSDEVAEDPVETSAGAADAGRIPVLGADGLLHESLWKRSEKTISGTLGDGTATQIAIQHDFGTKAIVSQVWEVATGETVWCGMIRTSDDVMTFRFAKPPADASLEFVIQKMT